MTKNTYLHISSTLGVFIVLVSICLLLISCDCKHKWAEAGCTTAKTHRHQHHAFTPVDVSRYLQNRSETLSADCSPFAEETG